MSCTGTILTADESDVDEQTAVGLRAVPHLVRLLTPGMVEARHRFSDGYESLKPEDAADAVGFVVGSPRQVDIGHAEILPTFRVPRG
ncbi:hypothetical protein [Streptomyces tremellae]|uniref:Short-chain dehydrogenase n=1 Tax=Streptomyces tremellae TaxID=1124239 RepID=A0ABP7DQM9_9ACTN